jgi:GDPmannose 4,6-dehydratase
MCKTAFITGITGQDGSYLAELLLDKGYQVYGLIRRLSIPNLSRISSILDRVILLEGDLSDQTSLDNAIQTAAPDEIYNLAAQSFVATSFKQPIATTTITGMGAVRVFESARRICSKAKIYQASSSEMFGNVIENPQNENTKFSPRSPYACAKVYAHQTALVYNEAYGMNIYCGICFNHESPRRGLEFVTRKITDGVARIYHEEQDDLHLGNLDSIRDWGFAGDYVKAMWMMLQQNEPDVYVVATQDSHSIREFVQLSFEAVGLDWEKYVVIDEKFFRPVDVTNLCGDYSKLKNQVGWEPDTNFKQLVGMMVAADMDRIADPVAESRNGRHKTFRANQTVSK